MVWKNNCGDGCWVAGLDMMRFSCCMVFMIHRLRRFHRFRKKEVPELRDYLFVICVICVICGFGLICYGVNARKNSVPEYVTRIARASTIVSNTTRSTSM